MLKEKLLTAPIELPSDERDLLHLLAEAPKDVYGALEITREALAIRLKCHKGIITHRLNKLAKKELIFTSIIRDFKDSIGEAKGLRITLTADAQKYLTVRKKQRR